MAGPVVYNCGLHRAGIPFCPLLAMTTTNKGKIAMGLFRLASKTRLCRVILIAWVTVLLPLPGAAADEPVKTVRIEGNFEDTLDGVKSAIQGKGINIAHTLPASNMLNSTGKDFGIEKNIFQQAETVEFCSARISHRLAQANHENILLCPFTISVYVLTDDPDHVHLSWRRPFGFSDAESQAAVQDMVDLIEGIIREATEW
ncbi:MAG: DUF302 domain-containing protein [Pseudomonadota bacterium]|nr:DUF302 domain-containing protein [Pseudomonadota bacterium]